MAISRRQFLGGLGVLGGITLLDARILALRGGRDPFEMLVVGDSLIAGQGLKEEDKIYSLVKSGIESDILSNRTPVRMKNFSHSGARLFLQRKERKALQQNGKSLTKFYHPEINFSFPSIRTQIDLAAEEYLAEGKKTADVDLVLLTGGITDINTSYILDGFKRYGPLREKIARHCNDGMFEFLRHASTTFEKALFCVVGYFPMVSPKSDSGNVYATVLEVYDFPGVTKPMLNNLLTKQLFKIIHGRMTKRSRLWLSQSNQALRTAVRRVNELNKRPTAIFVESPIPENRAYATKNTLLWRYSNGRTEDDKYEVRLAECSPAIDSLKDVGLTFRKRFCEMSGLGHPNPEGARLYASAIMASLRSELSVRSTAPA